jgi:hypothetical protein
MTILARIYLAMFALLAGCTQPSPDASLTVRQVAWPGRRAVEVAVGEQRLEVTATIRDSIVDRQVIPISKDQSDQLRRLFWRALQNQPPARHVPALVDGILVEQVWQGPERAWRVSTRGPLTKYESNAFNYLNPLLPAAYRFRLRLGLHAE